MARGRMLLKSLSLCAQLADLSDDTARLLFCMCIPHLDRDGRLVGEPRRLAATVWPLLHGAQATARALAELVEQRLVEAYADERGQAVLWFPAFVRSQPGLRRDREGESKFGPPPVAEPSGQIPAWLREYSGPTPEYSRQTPEYSGPTPERSGVSARKEETPDLLRSTPGVLPPKLKQSKGSEESRAPAGARVATTAPPDRTDGKRRAVVCDGCDEAVECSPSEDPPGWKDGLCPECQRHEPSECAKPAGQAAGYLQDIKAQGAAGRSPGTEPMNPVARQIAEHIRAHRRFDKLDAGEIANSSSHLVETGGKSLSWLRAAIDECNRDAASAAAAGEPWEPRLLAQKLGRYLWKARRPEPTDQDESEASPQQPPLYRDDGPRPDPEDTKRWAREAAEKLKSFRVGKRMPAG